MSGLSTRSVASITKAAAETIAADLNSWLYSIGGMCADSRTRAAVVGLRVCWPENGQQPEELYKIRNAGLTFLRRDLDLGDPEFYDFGDTSTLLNDLQDDLAKLERSKRRH